MLFDCKFQIIDDRMVCVNHDRPIFVEHPTELLEDTVPLLNVSECQRADDDIKLAVAESTASVEHSLARDVRKNGFEMFVISSEAECFTVLVLKRFDVVRCI